MTRADAVVAERRRLAGMLPGAEIEPVAFGFVALVRDVDVPIPVLVERGGYELLPAAATETPRSRRLVRGDFELLLVDSADEFARLTPGGRAS